MSAQPFSLLVNRAELATVVRTICVDFPTGYAPNITIGREHHDGRPIAALRIFFDALDALAEAIEATRRGAVGILRSGSISLDVRDRDVLAVGMVDADGNPRAACSIILARTGELDRLAEAHCIASRWLEGGAP